jgi:hypothetical protein
LSSLSQTPTRYRPGPFPNGATLASRSAQQILLSADSLPIVGRYDELKFTKMSLTKSETFDDHRLSTFASFNATNRVLMHSIYRVSGGCLALR